MWFDGVNGVACGMETLGFGFAGINAILFTLLLVGLVLLVFLGVIKLARSM